ncbi:MAG: glycosyltransferase family 4 protein [bacterium]|nr:glycosyltransferase family 4 protein [bacterium]
MKILYLHRTQAKSVERVHIRGIVDAMRDAGHEVLVVGPPGIDPYAPVQESTVSSIVSLFAKSAPEVLFEFAEMAYDRRLIGRLATAVAEFKPDLIYERYAFFGAAGSNLALRLGVPHVIEVNYTCDDPLVRRRSRLLMASARRLERKIFGRAAVLASVSSRLSERLLDRGVAPKRIVLTPNAVSRTWLSQAADIIPAEMPATFGDVPVTGFVGGFWPWHGLDRLVAAAARARNSGCPTALLLVGDGPERDRIMAMIKDEGLEDLACLPGNIEHAGLPAWIAAMDICVMPHSNDYGSPMKVFEYMSLTKPVLAPKLPPLEDVIEDNVSGRLFGNYSTAAEGSDTLGDVLIELLRDEESRSRMARNAVVRMWREFTWQANLNRIFFVLGLASPFPDDDAGCDDA